MSRYERFSRQPSLETVFDYETIFGTPVRELLVGAYQKIATATEKRAQLLAQKLSAAKPDRTTARKLQVLQALSSPAKRAA